MSDEKETSSSSGGETGCLIWVIGVAFTAGLFGEFTLRALCLWPVMLGEWLAGR
jgi:hypothetical protein